MNASAQGATSDSPEQSYDFDLIVLGAGPVGENVADYATKHGLRVAIVESELVGGECSYWACMPSKALLRSSNALRAARRVPGAREAVTAGINAGAVLARRDEFASNWNDDGQASWLESAGIELIRGAGRLVGRGIVRVGGRDYCAPAIAVATGSVPVLPPISGLAQAEPWGTREATSADKVPPRLIILGGGVAGWPAPSWPSPSVRLVRKSRCWPAPACWAGRNHSSASWWRRPWTPKASRCGQGPPRCPWREMNKGS